MKMPIWITRHPLIVQFALITTLLISFLLGYFYPSYREFQAINSFKEIHPDCHINIKTTQTAPGWVFDLLQKAKLEKYATRIWRMELHGVFNSSRQLTSEFELDLLPSFQKLRILSLSGCFLNSNSMSNISQLKHLVQLRMESCEIIDDGSLTLHNMESLKEFYSNYLTLKKVDLKNLPRLKILDLKNARIGDELIDQLSPVSGSLTSLGIANSNITDEGLKKLHDLPKLEFVDLRFTRSSPTGNPNYTWEGVTQLKSHPTLENVGISSTFDAEILKKIKVEAPRFVTRWDSPVRPEERERRILEVESNHKLERN